MEILNITVSDQWVGHTLADLIGVFHVGDKKYRKLQEDNLISVNAEFVAYSTILKINDIIKIDLTPFEKRDFVPESSKITVLYENDWMLIIDKPSGIIIYPETKNQLGTLVNRIAGFYEHRGYDRQIRYLHRLDKDTTGCFACAKHFLAHSYYSHLWDHHQIERTYLAFVTGQLVNPKGTISAPISKNRHVNNKFRVSATGDQATTEYEVVDDYVEYSLVRLRLITGKTHQIRVHMAHIGHPLLGDPIYGGDMRLIKRTALHSETITFPNPLKNVPVTVLSPLPKDMASLIKARRP
ncbi:MAG: RluA family pseudouridine synthase [Candidatus Izemoplasmatales bacterium]|jgi:23S rRNA pseudouridine1911/1915/1917 synthase